MNIKFIRTSLSALVLSLCIAAPAMAADTYSLDASHTAITWHINHFGFSNPSGKFMNVKGTLLLDEENPAASKVNVTIPIETINTGVAKLDEHLKGSEFFDVTSFPNATFISNKVEITGEKTAIVHGDLSLHGITKPVILDVTLNKLAPNMFKKQTAGFTAKTIIKRSDFGMTTYLPGLGDEVKITIESEANLMNNVPVVGE